MKNTIKLFEVIAFLAIIWFTLAACSDDDNSEPETPLQPGESVSNPINMSSDTNLGTMTSPASGWRQLLDSIEREGNYVNLDLSGCTMTGTSFNPDPSVTTGKDKIVSIILPTVATSIEAGTTLSNPAFKNFSNLKSISGVNISIVDNYSFSNSFLESINFPLVTTIGRSAFYSSSRLKNASFPVVQSISADAFEFCSDLESISFPASAELGRSGSSYTNPFTYCRNLTFTLSGSGHLSVIENDKALVRNDTILLAYPSASGTVTMNNITSLDGSVFYGCYDLDSINLPQVTNIGSNAFTYCSNLQDVSFPQVTTIGSSAFSSCSRLQSASFPLVTTIGSSAFSSCSNLVTLNIPSVTSMSSNLVSTGETILSITMGSVAPTFDWRMFEYIDTAKTVRVKVPTGATGYSPASSPFPSWGMPVTVNSGTTENWANGFRGGGWDGDVFYSNSISQGVNYINQNITLIIERQ